MFRGRRDQDPPGMREKVERIMQEQGVSEPVARNLIKYGKFGIGPMAGGQLASQAAPAPSMQDAAEGRKRKLREQEERLQALEKQREDERQPAAQASFSPFERAAAPKAARSAPRLGLVSLGAVHARPESIDPLMKLDVPVSAEADGDSGGKERPAGAATAGPASRLPHEGKPAPEKRRVADAATAGAASHLPHEGKPAPEKRRMFTEEARRRPTKKKKKRRREAGSSESEDVAKDVAHAGSKAAKEAAPRHPRAASPSSASEPPEPPREARPAASGSLMTEAEVRAMMKGKKPERGSARAKARIQREKQEWETAKSSNPEFWKAPKFALCYSGETTKNRGY